MRQIPQRELRNDVTRVLREVEAGEIFEVSVRGRIVAEMRPARRRAWTAAAAAREVLGPPADAGWLEELRADRQAAEAEERDLWP